MATSAVVAGALLGICAVRRRPQTALGNGGKRPGMAGATSASPTWFANGDAHKRRISYTVVWQHAMDEVPVRPAVYRPGTRKNAASGRTANSSTSSLDAWLISTTAAVFQESERRSGLLVQTLTRVILPTLIAFAVGTTVYEPVAVGMLDLLDVANTGQGPILRLLGMDQSQFMQNFLTVNGLLFTILCGNTYMSLYNQQEQLYHALFLEVSEAKSLLEQACLLCQGRSIYPQVLQSIGDYVENDLRRLDMEPAELLATQPMDDPLEYILYVTSVGVPSIIYDTVRDLRRARGLRLGAMQRKLPAVHFVLLYVLGFLELLAFPLLGAGTASMFVEQNVLTIQAVLFGAMCGAIVMTLQVVYELWKPFGGAYTVDAVLRTMVRGLEEELVVRKRAGGFRTVNATPFEPPANTPDGWPQRQ